MPWTENLNHLKSTVKTENKSSCEHNFWSQQFLRHDRTSQHCFLICLLSLKMRNYSQHSVMFAAVTILIPIGSVSLLFFLRIPSSSLPQASMSYGAPEGASHSREWHQFPCDRMVGAHLLPPLRCFMNFFFFFYKYLFIHLGSLNGFSNQSLVNNIIKVITKVMFLLVCIRDSIISIYNIFLFNKVKCIITISIFSLTNMFHIWLSETTDSCLSN